MTWRNVNQAQLGIYMDHSDVRTAGRKGVHQARSLSAAEPQTTRFLPDPALVQCSSEFAHPHPNIRRERCNEQHRQYRRPVLVVVHAFRTAPTQTVRAVHEDDRRVRDRNERDPREAPRTDEAHRVVSRDEVEQRRRDRADEDTKV